MSTTSETTSQLARRAETTIRIATQEIVAAIDAEPVIDQTAIEREVLAQARIIQGALRDVEGRVFREASRIATSAAEMAAREIEEAFYDFGDGDADERRAGVRLVLDELERTGCSDEIAGVTRLDDVVRTIRRRHA